MELLPTPALDPELLNLTAPHLPMNMALRLTLDLDLVMLWKLPENMAPLLTTHMALLPKPLAPALARSPPTPTLPLPLTRTPGGVDAREELGLPGEAKLSAEVVARRTVLPSRARPSSRGGPPRPPRGSSRGADVDSSPSQSPTGAHTGMPLPSAMLDVASRIRLNPSLLNSQVLSLQVTFTNSCLPKP